MGASAAAVSDDKILDVDGCSDISSLSKRFLSDFTGTSTCGGLTSKINVGRVMIIPLKINFINDAFRHKLAFSCFKSREKAKDDSSRLRCINEPEVTNARLDFFSYRV